MSRAFDAIVVGTGQAGPPLAGRLTAAGMTVAVVERKLFGGTCVNTGCTPTKTLVASAAIAHHARRAAAFGVHLDGPVRIDMPAVRARKEAVIKASRDGLEGWLRGLAGCTVVTGHARLEDARSVRVGTELLTAPRIFLDVGGRAAVPDFPGLGEVATLTNTTVLELDAVPAHLVVVGGSYIGLEFAQIFRRFGAAVTVVEKGPRLVGREDEDVCLAVQHILEAEGIAVRLNAECIRFAPHGTEVTVGVDCTTGEPQIVGSHVLLAVGRRPNTDDLGLDRAGVATDARGFIRVDDRLETTAPGVFALGDCNGRGAFTHTAYNDFEIVAANLLDGGDRKVSDRVPGYALYIDPPLGRAGMTEREARAAGHAVKVGKRPMTRVGRAVEKGETQGFLKTVVDRDSDRILGGAILGVGGDEAIHGLLDAINAKATAGAFTRAVPIHPTVSELIPTVLGEAGP